MAAPDVETAPQVRMIGAGPGYADGAEDAVLDILRRASDRSTGSDELAASVSDWPTRYHLSRRRANVLRPLRLGPGMRVLDVGAGTGVMARYAAEQGASVVALEGTLARAQAAAVRCQDFPAVEVVCGPLDAYQDADGFDVVLCVGVLEYAGPDHAGFLRRLRGLTRPQGALVLAIENQLGLKYLVGYGEDHLAEPWVGVEGYPGPGGIRTFSRRRLASLLADAGFGGQRWLFPFPDYKTPAVILDRSAYEQPDHEVVVDALVRWPCDGQASAPARLCDDRGTHRTFLAAGLGPEVANSFLVIAGADDAAATRLVEPAVTAWFYGSERSRAWLGAKLFSREGGDGQVVARGAETVGDGWLRQRRAAPRPWVPGRTVEQQALAACEESAAAVAEVLGRWRSHLRSLEAPAGEGGPHPFRDATTSTVLPPDHLDVDLANFVVDDEGAIHYVDSEWVLPSGVDADLACARALWWFASEVVSRGVAHPWPRSTTVAQLADALGLLCATPAGAAALDRWREVEAQLQAEVTGRDRQDCLRELAAMDDRSQAGADVVRQLPFTELRRRLMAAEERLPALEYEYAARESDRETLLDLLAEEQAERADLLRRVQSHEDDRFVVVHALDAERVTSAELRAERDALAAELAEVRPAATRWVAFERRRLVKVYRLAQRLLRR